MAFLFKKKKGSTTRTSSDGSGDGTQQQAAGSGKKQGTPTKNKRRTVTTTPPTAAIPLTRSPDSIMKARQGGYEDFEVLTPETRSAIQEREDIRKQLFSDSLDEGDFPSNHNSPCLMKTTEDYRPTQPSRLERTATAQSMEVTADGIVLTATEEEEEEANDHVVKTTSRRIPVSSSTKKNTNNFSTMLPSLPSPPRHGYPLSGSHRHRPPPRKDRMAAPSPSHGSISSAVYRGPVSVDSPARVITKAGQPFDESMEKDNEDESTRKHLMNQSINSSMMTVAPQDDSSSNNRNKTHSTTLSSSGIIVLQPEPRSISSASAPVDLDETGDSISVTDTRTTTANDTFTAGGSTAQDTVTQVAEQLLGSFHCGGGSPKGVTRSPLRSMKGTLDEIKKSRSVQKVMDLFYDRSARADASSPDEHRPAESTTRRPYYDETFTVRFIRRMTTKGAALLHLQAPSSPGNDSLDWKGRTVTMLLERGTTTAASGHHHYKQQLLPRLEWTTIAGGQSFDVTTNSVGLFDILSISTSLKNLDKDGESKQADHPDDDDNKDGYDQEDNNLCFFTITATNGDLHVFEANSVEERDSLVNGLKNVISRMAFHLVVGDATASSELFDFDHHNKSEQRLSGDLPSLANPREAMNRLAHLMLD